MDVDRGIGPAGQVELNALFAGLLRNAGIPGGQPMTLAMRILQARSRLPGVEAAKTYVLFGDPAMRLK